VVAFQDVPEGWVPGSWLGRSICRTCGRRWLDHDRNSPTFDRSAHSFGAWVDQIGILDIDDAAPNVIETTADTAEAAGWFTLMRFQTWEQEGEYGAPLPPPSERKRIRAAGGWTQHEVGEHLHVNRHTVKMWERRAGYNPSTGLRYPGREPRGGIRKEYSDLLLSMLLSTGG
jgi:DNA-binding transcriptional regulator YiaG